MLRARRPTDLPSDDPQQAACETLHGVYSAGLRAMKTRPVTQPSGSPGNRLGSPDVNKHTPSGLHRLGGVCLGGDIGTVLSVRDLVNAYRTLPRQYPP